MMRGELTREIAKSTFAGSGTYVAVSDPQPMVTLLGMSLGDWAAAVTIVFVVFQIVDLAPKVWTQKIKPTLKKLFKR